MTAEFLLHCAWVTSVAALVLLPPAMMIATAQWSREFRIGTILATLAIGGLVLANVAMHTYGMYLNEIVMRMPDPDPDHPVVRRWQADGARNVFALMFGWAYGPALWVVWSPVFAGVWVVRKIRSRVRAASVAD